MSICFTVQKVVQAIVRADPILIALGLIEIRWYAVAYAVGALFALWYVRRVLGNDAMYKSFLDSLLSWTLLGTIVGGRLGYVLFYGFAFYRQNPAEILQIWHGGMSFHGGFLGCLISVFLVCRKYNVPFLRIADLCSCSLPVGLFLGRLANLVNGELYGKATESCLGTVFPLLDTTTRHPTQLYEALVEGLFCFILLNLLRRFTRIAELQGTLFCLFCLWYSTGRFAIEFLREPDPQLGYLAFGWLTMGQVLSLPFFLAALVYGALLLHKNGNRAAFAMK